MRLALSTVFLIALSAPLVAEERALFDGKTFDGWEGDTEKTWRIEDGAIVGGSFDTVVAPMNFSAPKQRTATLNSKSK